MTSKDHRRARRTNLTEILAHVSRQAVQGDSLQPVLRGIVEGIVERLPVAVASIILLNEAGSHFTTEVLAGDLDLSPPDGGLPWPVTVGAAGRCARLGRAQWIPDVGADPDYVAGNREVRAEYLVPIHHRGSLLGVLNLESTDRSVFSAEVRTVFDAIAAQVAGVIHLARVIAELESANRRLRDWAMCDGLTGIANRRCFDARLCEEWRRHGSERAPLALALVDADCFKRLNDSRGHLYGDDCLRELAHVCAAACPAPCLAARLGGEELAMLMPNTGLRPARALAEKTRRAFAALALRHPDSPVAPVVTISVGVAALVPTTEAPPQRLLDLADRALYRAKRTGRNRVVARTG
ncbi:MAG: diguanylate cyclase [Xanthomonadales bacterium]|nr:hypothetical protein [Xanthomonadales bacterium]MCC6592660.1 diguanylate cyclase [Xanthomonadales bacterium]